MTTESKSSIHHTSGASVYSGREAVNVFGAITVASALDLYAKTGMRVNRAYTPTAMLAAVERYTGRKFKRGQYAEAAAHLREWARAVRAGIPETSSRPEDRQHGETAQEHQERVSNARPGEGARS